MNEWGLYCSILFQFHKGTIKTKPLSDSYSIEELFQFHKGTIKTWVARQPGQRMLFQFHKGTIKTFVDVVEVMHQVGFNSIKVRLRPHSPAPKE